MSIDPLTSDLIALSGRDIAITLMEGLKLSSSQCDRYRKLWLESTLPAVEQWAANYGHFNRSDFEAAPFCRGLSTPECRMLLQFSLEVGAIALTPEGSVLPYRKGDYEV